MPGNLGAPAIWASSALAVGFLRRGDLRWGDATEAVTAGGLLVEATLGFVVVVVVGFGAGAVVELEVAFPADSPDCAGFFAADT